MKIVWLFDGWICWSCAFVLDGVVVLAMAPSITLNSAHSYYQLEDPKPDSINHFLSEIVQKALFQLDSSYCIEVEEVGHTHTYTHTCIICFSHAHLLTWTVTHVHSTALQKKLHTRILVHTCVVWTTKNKQVVLPFTPLHLWQQDGHTLHPSTLGCIASFYYLHHTSIKLFREKLYSGCTQEELLKVLCVSTCLTLYLLTISKYPFNPVPPHYVSVTI